MTIARDKTRAITIAMLLILSMGASMMLLPTTNAQGTMETYAYIGAVPNPVGVNQEVLLHVGVTLAVQSVEQGWEGLSITIKRPDGKTDTFTDIRTDSTGGTGRVYVPDIEGNYTVQSHFPAQNTTATKRGRGISVGTWLEASDSAELTLVVQADPIPYYPGHALPTEYWTRPIDPQLREWYAVSGSWLYTPTNFIAVGNDDAPETAHVLWTKPFTSGGLVGGDIGLAESINQGAVGFETGDAYEGKWSGLIIAGRLYYRTGAYDRPNWWYCVDLRTGEQLWAKTFLENASLSFGQLYYWESYNYMGTFPYLWVTSGTTWTAFDAFTGEWRATMTNMPSGTTLRDGKGGIYILQSSLTNGWIALWNMSAFISMAGSWGSAFSLREWNVSSGTYRSLLSNGSLGSVSTSGAADRVARALSWNVTTLPKNIVGSVRATNFGDKIVGASITTKLVNLWAFSLASDNLGSLLYNETWNAPAAWASGNQSVAWMTANFEDNAAVLFSTETCENYGFSIETGKYLWGPSEPENYLNALDDSKSSVRAIAYGKLYSASVSGIVYCYDVQTGDLLWTYEALDPYSEILWANTWWLKPLAIADGKIYLGHTEHSANQPLPRGAPFLCLNATTGEVIFRVDGMFRQTRWGGRAIMGDSIIATMDTYDQSVYAIGKGPSATTVSAGPKVSVHGSNVVVEGMVTDISPGTNSADLTMRFPSGVPAVSDANMSEWMLYVYKQFERPADVVGVEVVVSVLDPNNNCYEVGRTTSDASGFFKLSFVPEVPGEYTVIATFEGSGAYYGSSAETAVNVEEAPAATPTPSPVPQEPVGTYFTVSTIAIIAAIVIVAILLLRKR